MLKYKLPKEKKSEKILCVGWRKWNHITPVWPPQFPRSSVFCVFRSLKFPFSFLFSVSGAPIKTEKKKIQTGEIKTVDLVVLQTYNEINMKWCTKGTEIAYLNNNKNFTVKPYFLQNKNKKCFSCKFASPQIIIFHGVHIYVFIYCIAWWWPIDKARNLFLTIQYFYAWWEKVRNVFLNARAQ
jgi:hypothetical protein